MQPESDESSNEMRQDLMPYSDVTIGRTLFRPSTEMGPGTEAVGMEFDVRQKSNGWSGYVYPKQKNIKNIRFDYQAANDDHVFRGCDDASKGSAGRCQIQYSWFEHMVKSGDAYSVVFVNQSTYFRIARFWVIYDF